jgi:hypothetical protein
MVSAYPVDDDEECDHAGNGRRRVNEAPPRVDDGVTSPAGGRQSAEW